MSTESGSTRKSSTALRVALWMLIVLGIWYVFVGLERIYEMHSLEANINPLESSRAEGWWMRAGLGVLLIVGGVVPRLRR